MGIFGFIKQGARELFIARPDEEKDKLVWKWPDQTIPNGAQITVGQDEVALFFRDGQAHGQLGAGRHTLDSANVAWLSLLMDSVTGGNLYRAEIWFVTTRELGGLNFGGEVGAVEDPRSGLAARTMVHGDFSLKVDDPVKVAAFFGQKSWSADEDFHHWFRSLLLKVIRDRIAEKLVKENMPILQVTSGAFTEEIEQLVIDGCKPHLESYGIRLVRLGNFVVVIDDGDYQKLQAFYTDMAQMKMSGGTQNYQQFAAGKAMLGAGQGMAAGGGGGGGGPLLEGAGLGVGIGMASMFQQQQHPAPAASPAPAPAAATLVACPKCQARVAPGKFCAECGGPLAEKKAFCGDCGSPLQPGKKFCSECGAKQG